MKNLIQKPRILVADDSEDMRVIIACQLEKAGWEVVLAVDGKDALEKARSEVFHMISTDNDMPVFTGMQLMECLHDLQTNTPVVMFSGGNENLADDFVALGGADFFDKITPSDYFQTLERHRVKLVEMLTFKTKGE